MGNRTRSSAYDPNNALTQTHARVFNALNRVSQDIGAQNQTSNYSYDNNGNITTGSDPLNHATALGYDALNRVVQITDPNIGSTRFSYDAHDHVTQVRDPRGLQTAYTYDVLNDRAQIVSPDTGATVNTFDAAGNLKTKTDARGAVTTYTYDALNRVTQISATLNGSTSATTFRYDSGPNALGKLTGVRNADSTLIYRFNNLGLLSAKTQQAGAVRLTERYAYDSAGRISHITYPSGQVIEYGYDAQGRINAIHVGSQALLSDIRYAPFGGTTGWTWGNGSTYGRTLDADGRITSYTLNGFMRTLTYDPAGRLTAINDGTVQNLTYDTLDRLTGYTAATASQTYSYDADGNRTAFTIGAAHYTATIPTTSNRLGGVSGPVARRDSYDPAGHLVGASMST